MIEFNDKQRKMIERLEALGCSVTQIEPTIFDKTEKIHILHEGLGTNYYLGMTATMPQSYRDRFDSDFDTCVRLFLRNIERMVMHGPAVEVDSLEEVTA